MGSFYSFDASFKYSINEWVESLLLQIKKCNSELVFQVLEETKKVNSNSTLDRVSEMELLELGGFLPIAVFVKNGSMRWVTLDTMEVKVQLLSCLRLVECLDPRVDIAHLNHYRMIVGKM